MIELKNITFGVSPAESVGIGYSALKLNTTGVRNTAIGHNSLSSNTTGSYNTAVGYNAGSAITGTGNIVIGYETQVANTAGNNQMNIGNEIFGTGINNSGLGNIGIGTPAPTQKLDVNGQVRIRGGNPGTGKVLTSDVNGVGTWQEASANAFPGIDVVLDWNNRYTYPQAISRCASMGMRLPLQHEAQLFSMLEIGYTGGGSGGHAADPSVPGGFWINGHVAWTKANGPMGDHRINPTVPAFDPATPSQWDYMGLYLRTYWLSGANSPKDIYDKMQAGTATQKEIASLIQWTTREYNYSRPSLVFPNDLYNNPNFQLGCICVKEQTVSPNPEDCSSYFEWNDGVPVLKPCPDGLHFNPQCNCCDSPANAGCEP